LHCTKKRASEALESVIPMASEWASIISLHDLCPKNLQLFGIML